MSKLVCTVEARSVFGIPPVGFEYVPVFFVKPQPLTVCSVTGAGIVGLFVRSL